MSMCGYTHYKYTYTYKQYHEFINNNNLCKDNSLNSWKPLFMSRHK